MPASWNLVAVTQRLAVVILSFWAFSTPASSLPTFSPIKCMSIRAMPWQTLADSSLMIQRPEARALTQRMPEALRHQDSSLQNCLTLLRAIWQTQHAQVYQALRSLPWPEGLRHLVRRYESMGFGPTGNCFRLLTFHRLLPRPDLDRRQHFLRGNTACCRSELLGSWFPGRRTRGPQYYAEVHGLWMDVEPGDSTTLPRPDHRTVYRRTTLQWYPWGDDNAWEPCKLDVHWMGIANGLQEFWGDFDTLRHKVTRLHTPSI